MSPFTTLLPAPLRNLSLRMWLLAPSSGSMITSQPVSSELRYGSLPIVGSDERVEQRTGLDDEFYLVGSGYMTFPHTGMFEFGLCSVGKSRLFVDDVLVVDNGYDKPQTIGDTFYGLGTREETGVSHARLHSLQHSYVQLTQHDVHTQVYHVELGKRYLVRVEFTNSSEGGRVSAETTNTGQPSLMLAALRVGGSFKLASSTEAIEDCATLAKECDAVICVTGGNLDWETEGADRTQFALPGATDELVESLLQANSNTIICNISVRVTRLNLKKIADDANLTDYRALPSVSPGWTRRHRSCNAGWVATKQVSARSSFPTHDHRLTSDPHDSARQRDGRRPARQSQPEWKDAPLVSSRNRALHRASQLGFREWQGPLRGRSLCRLSRLRSHQEGPDVCFRRRSFVFDVP